MFRYVPNCSNMFQYIPMALGISHAFRPEKHVPVPPWSGTQDVEAFAERKLMGFLKWDPPNLCFNIIIYIHIYYIDTKIWSIIWMINGGYK
jgi:hypothetical protein